MIHILLSHISLLNHGYSGLKVRHSLGVETLVHKLYRNINRKTLSNPTDQKCLQNMHVDQIQTMSRYDRCQQDRQRSPWNY